VQDNDGIDAALREFAEEMKIVGKGSPSAMLGITQKARGLHPPFKEADFLTAKGGQVAGLGRTYSLNPESTACFRKKAGGRAEAP
jgi:hypothetical protein